MKRRTQMLKSHNQSKLKKIFRIFRSFALAAGFCLMTALPAAAAEDTEYEDVYINGYKLGFFEQLALEDHIDRDIPDGHYWFEMDTGLWGPVGGSAIGYIEVPEDYREYVESKLSKQSKVTEVELSASAEECDHRCLYW